MGVLRHRRRDPQSVGTIREAQSSGGDALAPRGSMKLILEPGKTETGLIDGACAQRLGVCNIHDLGASGIFAAKAGQKRIGNVLVILIEEVVAGKKSDAGIEVNSSARLIVGETLRCVSRGEISVSTDGGVGGGNIGQQILRRHGDHAGGYLRTRKDAIAFVTTSKKIRLSLGNGIAQAA